MQKQFLLIIFILLSYNCYSQQHPWALKWQKIESEHYRFIFTTENSETAQYGINLLEHSFDAIRSPLEVEPKKIPVILKSESVYTNGYVALGPRHMAWYLTPFQDISSTLDGSDWITNLTLHEGRHIAQFDKLDYGFTGFMGDIAGDLGKSLCINLSMPYWFFEGDAIQSETKNSCTGRGRTPSFFKGYRCFEGENIRYSYNKLYFGSYKNFTSDIYKMGYLITSHINRNYGENIWPQLLNSVSKQSYSPFAFSYQLKKHTGYNLKETLQNTLNEFDSIWGKHENPFNQAYPEYEKVIPVNSKHYTNYTFPLSIDNDKYIAIKSGLSYDRRITKIEAGSEETLIYLPNTERIHTNGKSIVWSETFKNVRWGDRSYSDIIVYNLISDNKIRLTHKQKLFAPAISPDNIKIAAIEFTSDSKCSLVILDARTGFKLSAHTFQKNEFARMPSWSEDGKKIVFTLSYRQNKTINVYDVENKVVRKQTYACSENISNPVFYGKYILYNTPISGVDEIHAIDTENQKRYRVAHSKYGVYNPNVNIGQNKMVFQDYTSNGFKAKTLLLEPQKWFEIAPDNFASNNYLGIIFPVKPDSILQIYPEKDSNYFVDDFSPLKNTFLIHSWHPTYGYKSVGFKLYSNDILNTASVTGGLNYYPKEFAHREYVNLTYAGLYPVISSEFSYGQKYSYMSDTTDTSAYRKIDEKLFALKVSLPLDISRGVFNNTIKLSSSYLYAWQNFKDREFYLSSEDQLFSALNFSLEAFSLKQKAPRDLYTRMGQEVLINYTQSIGKTSFDGKRYSIISRFYLPGAFLSHSLRFSLGYEKNEGDYIQSIYLLNSQVVNVRGYKKYYFEEVKKITVDYSFPILHPDLNLGAFLYMKRVHGSVFYDWGDYIYKRSRQTFESVGMDLNFETFFFRLPVPWELGIRYSRRLYDSSNSFEFLLFRNAF
jgi:hypothetical protein